jgi:hypothetical protein
MFGLKKKKEVLDLRPKDSDMPLPAKMREKLIAGPRISLIAGNSTSASVDSRSIDTSSSTSANSSSNSSGGFFSFFGGGDSSSSVSDSSSSVISDNTSSQVGDLSYRLSRLLDRIELVEKKLERLERRNGVDSSNI